MNNKQTIAGLQGENGLVEKGGKRRGQEEENPKWPQRANLVLSVAMKNTSSGVSVQSIFRLAGPNLPPGPDRPPFTPNPRPDTEKEKNRLFSRQRSILYS